MQNRQNEKTALVKNICMLSVIVVVNIFYVYFSKWFHTLDGDFNAYIWGAKLLGIAEALKQGELRLWNPNIWCGISGIHNFSDSFYPFAILVCKIFWNADKEILSFMAYYAFTLIHSIIATTGFFSGFKRTWAESCCQFIHCADWGIAGHCKYSIYAVVLDSYV